MTKKTVFGVAVVAIAAFGIVAPASASCIPDKSASTYGQAGSKYWLPAGAQGTSSGIAWQLGAPGSYDSRGGAVPCPQDNTVWYFSAGGGNLNLHLGACGAGCPATGSSLAVLYQSSGLAGTDFLLDTAVEVPSDAVNFDFSVQGNHQMIPIPRPAVLSSSRAPGVVNLSVQIPSIAGGLYGPNAASAVTGFRILTKSSATDPGRDAASFDVAPAAIIANPGGTGATQAVVLNCTNPADQWLVTQIQFENGAVLSNAVSSATRVRCDPALANPGNYKIVPKKLAAPTRDAQ
jgi:hypothetical protein